MPEFVMCDCGRPLHYASKATRERMDALVAEMGETVIIVTTTGAWHVPRHFVALHGIQAPAVSALADFYGWSKASEKDREAAEQ